MKIIILTLLAVVYSLFAFTVAHKYFVSITQIEFVEEQQSVQVITRVFTDDLEHLLQERYDQSITLNETEENAIANGYIEKYLLDKIQIKINNDKKDMLFIGNKYEDDILYCYLEVENVSSIENFEIQNNVFFDVFEDQKNIVKTTINDKKKSFVLVQSNNNGVINF